MSNNLSKTAVLKQKLNCKLKLEQRIAPCKGIQNSLGFWIPCCGFRIPGTGFRIPAQWIPDSKKSWIPSFFQF